MAPNEREYGATPKMPQNIKLAIIYGSAREGRFCDTVVNWVATEVRGHQQFAIDLIDPRDLANGRGDVARRLDEADAFIVVTPEYNHGYTADLKALIDAHSIEWQAKPLAFVSYGGISGGLRALHPREAEARPGRLIPPAAVPAGAPGPPHACGSWPTVSGTGS